MPYEGSIEWFARLADVPGLDWSPPGEISVDQRFVGAQPYVEGSDGDEYVWVRWVDRHGQPLGEYGFHSPAEILTDTVAEQATSAEIILTTLGSLAVPGTRHDYYSALERATGVLARFPDQNADRVAWLEHLLWLTMRLGALDPQGALRRQGGVRHDLEEHKTIVAQLSRPYARLISLYLAEGFLLDAAKVREALTAIGASADEVRFIADPAHVIGSLTELVAARTGASGAGELAGRGEAS